MDVEQFWIDRIVQSVLGYHFWCQITDLGLLWSMLLPAFFLFFLLHIQYHKFSAYDLLYNLDPSINSIQLH